MTTDVEETREFEGPEEDERYRVVLVNAKILVVDDSRPVRLVHKRTLESAKAYVDEAENGKMALAALKKAKEEGRPYDLVLTDLTMPEMGGLDLLKAIRQDPQIQKTRVVIVSSASEKEKVLECAKLGISGYLIKPSKTKVILDTIGQALLSMVERATPSSNGLSSEIVKEIKELIEKKRQEYSLTSTNDPVGEAILAFLKAHASSL